MKKPLQLFILLFIFICTSNGYGQTELLTNGGAESNEVDSNSGTPNGWTEENGEDWAATSPSTFSLSGNARSGSRTFIPVSVDATESWRLTQTADVSGNSTDIDNGNATIDFRGFIRSNAGIDGALITVEFLNGSGSVISTFTSPIITNTVWTQVSDIRTAPTGTRSIRVALLANDGDNDTFSDIFIDDVSLTIAISNTAPSVTNAVSDFSVNEDSPNDTFDLTNIFSDSEDNDADLTYSVVSNNNTGLVSATVNNTSDELTLDYQTDQSGAADITIRAEDSGGLTVDDAFTVTVNNIAPVFNSSTTASFAENGTGTALDVNADNGGDGADDSGITYSFGGGADDGEFNIDVNSGALSFQSTPDFENPTDSDGNNNYEVQVTADDGKSANNATTQSITISVTDLAPDTPTDSDGATNTIAENASNGDAVGVTGSSSDPGGGTVTYLLTDDAGGRFTINSSTGVVTVADATQLDFETTTSHDITIAAQDADNTQSSGFTTSISVSNVAPDTPTDSDGTANAVAENAANTTAVGITASSSDPSGGTVTFSLTDDAGGRFALNADGVTVEVADNSLLDAGTNSSHNITIQASDGNLNSSDTFTININPAAPVFEGELSDLSETVNVVESSTNIFDADANDDNGGATDGSVIYSIASITDDGSGDQDGDIDDDSNAPFNIDSNGLITVADTDDFDFQNADGATQFTITVRASDDGVDTDATLTVNIIPQLFLNEVFFDPDETNGTDTLQYVELRGDAGITVPENVFLVNIEGSGTGAGTVDTYFDLNGQTLGSNGFFVLLQDGHPYTVDASAETLVGNSGGFSDGSGTVHVGGGSFETGSQSFLLVASSASPTLSDFDSDDNGVLEGDAANWTVVDAIGADVNGSGGDVVYGGTLHFSRGGDAVSSGGNSVSIGFGPGYVGRQQGSTGSTSTDWLASQDPVGSTDGDVTLDGTNVEPSSFAGKALAHIGSANLFNASPTATGGDLFGLQDDVVFISTADIGFDDADLNDALTQIEITNLPATGTLANNTNDNMSLDSGEELNVNDVVSKTDLDADRLVWVAPMDGTSGYRVDSFDYNVSDGTAQSVNATIQFTLNADSAGVMGTSGENDWHLLGSPTDATPSNLLDDIWTQGVTAGGDTDQGSPNVYTFDESTQSYSAVTDLTAGLGTGTGMAVFVFADDDFSDGGSTIDGDWPKKLTVGGNQNTGTVNIPLSNTDSDGTPGLSGDEGWNLITNPYGTTIEVDSVLANLTDVAASTDANVYIWDKTLMSGTGDWEVLGGTAGDKIAPFQSFFVRILTSSVSGNLTLGDDDRSTGSQALLKQPPEAEHSQLLLSLTKTEGDSTAERLSSLRFTKTGREGLDPQDVYDLAPLSADFMQLSSLVGDQLLRHNNLPAGREDQVSIPLTFSAGQSGLYSIGSRKENLPEDVNVILIDHQIGQQVALSNGQSYNFEYTTPKNKRSPGTQPAKLSSKLQTAGEQARFELKLGRGLSVSTEEPAGDLPEKFELQQNFPNPFNPSTTIAYNLPKTADVSLAVYNVLGRQVATLLDKKQTAGRHQTSFDASNLSSGIYIYRLQAGGKVFTRKMILVK